MEKNRKKEDLVRKMLGKGVLLSPDMLSEDSDILNEEAELEEEKSLSEAGMLVLSKDILEVTENSGSGQLQQLNWKEFEKARVMQEKSDDRKVYSSFLEAAQEQQESESLHEDAAQAPEILFSYDKEGRSWEVKDFVSHMRVRFRALSNILRDRPELANATAIGHAPKMDDNIAFIGFVTEIRETRKKNIMFTIEDQTGNIRVVVSKSKPDVFEMAKDLVQDEMVGLTGTKKGNIVFVSNLFLPEVPVGRETKKYPGDCMAAVISDVHTGSINFLEEEFKQFIGWMKGEVGNEEQRAVAARVKYLFILGDLVAGVGIYPGQEEELTIPSLKGQFDRFAELIREIPEHIHIIIITGNHDGIRLAEPQPPLSREFAASLYELPNVMILSNPAWVRLLKNEDFPGFDFLLYHGYSHIYYADNVNSLRQAGGVEKAGNIMKFLLRRRHLAPSHGSTLYIPDSREDPLLIKSLPDFFLSGHLHKSEVMNYKGTTLICGSCWEKQTSFEKKLGLHPEPARVPVIDFRTRQVKIMKFTEM